MTSPILELRNVQKQFKDFVAVRGVDLSVSQGEFLTLLGPSGCGKTTTLNLIAGFLQPTAGSILLGGAEVGELPPFKRDTAMVFQDYALFPHMTVSENVAFGLRMRKVSKPEIATRVAKALDLVRLGHLGARLPAELSGGQKQRVALARAMVTEPAVLLFDEPLSNLDLKLRESMRLEITNLQKQIGITAIFVTHDQSEALVMSDRIAVMNGGIIEQLGTPREIYERPSTKFVAEFIGAMNFVEMDIDGVPSDRLVTLSGPQDNRLSVPVDFAATTGARTHVAVRPERTRIASDAAQDQLRLKGVVRQVIYLGSRIEAHVDVGAATNWIVDLPSTRSTLLPARGDDVILTADAQDCVVLQ